MAPHIITSTYFITQSWEPVRLFELHTSFLLCYTACSNTWQKNLSSALNLRRTSLKGRIFSGNWNRNAGLKNLNSLVMTKFRFYIIHKLKINDPKIIRTSIAWTEIRALPNWTFLVANECNPRPVWRYTYW